MKTMLIYYRKSRPKSEEVYFVFSVFPTLFHFGYHLVHSEVVIAPNHLITCTKLVAHGLLLFLFCFFISVYES